VGIRSHDRRREKADDLIGGVVFRSAQPSTLQLAELVAGSVSSSLLAWRVSRVPSALCRNGACTGTWSQYGSASCDLFIAIGTVQRQVIRQPKDFLPKSQSPHFARPREISKNVLAHKKPGGRRGAS
jgi:hypothetical protein